MWKKFCGWLLKVMGWTVDDSNVVPEDKCIILGVPHTSAWDFIISYLFYTSIGGHAKVMVKKEFFFWPIGGLLRKIGGLPVDRKNATRLVLSTIKEMKEAKVCHLALAPEGTRKPIKRWKTGFHTIAREVGCPVYMGYFDWGTKRVSRGHKIELTDDAKADMARIQALYEEMHLVGKHPEMYITH
jgi:1-acyl-sn-glycerol-3-phosphate acyltransferase